MTIMAVLRLIACVLITVSKSCHGFNWTNVDCLLDATELDEYEGGIVGEAIAGNYGRGTMFCGVPPTVIDPCFSLMINRETADPAFQLRKMEADVGYFSYLCEGFSLKQQLKNYLLDPPQAMNQPPLHCTYSRGLRKPEPYFYVGRLKVEQRSLDPEITVIHELLYEGELLEMVLDSVHKARVSTCCFLFSLSINNQQRLMLNM